MLGPLSTIDTVYARADAIKEDATQLGISSTGDSGQKNFDEQTVSFLFLPEDAGVQLASFSDDGISVTITDLETGQVTQPLNFYGVGQALPNLSEIGRAHV